ncbi:MAG TPA: helix-turn-helix transcriptional regulator [Gammaproteobacteria bacterium]|nr:helix-turn-helix transcriptional regulator [Gammaproteobacteria bacterium]
MDMRIDAKRIRAERERRAWSQEHLATVTGLGLRTIQRIEKTGAASFESARSLAAVFEVGVAELRLAHEEPRPSHSAALSTRWRSRARPVLGGAAAALTAAGALFVATKGLADVVMLDVGVSMNDSQVELSQVVTEANDHVALRAIDDMLRMVVVPTIEKNGIMLATEIYVLEGDGYVLASSPKLLVENGKPAEIELTTKDGTSIHFSITPHQNPPHLPPTLREL